MSASPEPTPSPSPSPRPAQRSLLDDLCVTFSSPMAWVLVLALVVTWSCVAIVLFDLLDYQTLVEYTSYCDDPCLPPGASHHQPVVRKALKAAGRSRASGSARSILTGSAEVTAEEGTDWLAILWAFLSSLVAPEEEEGEGIQQLTETFSSFVSEEL